MKEYEVCIDVLASFDLMRAMRPRVKESEVKHEVSGVTVVQGLPPEGSEVIVEIKEPETKGSFKARAIFSSKPEDFPEGDRVWFTRAPGGRLPQPWGVKIIEKIEEEEEREVKPLSRRRLSLGEKKGRLLEELLKEREKKLKKK